MPRTKPWLHFMWPPRILLCQMKLWHHFVWPNMSVLIYISKLISDDSNYFFLCVLFFLVESVAVGVVVKNPLRGVPLLMTNLSLVWEATPTTRTTSQSSPAPVAAAVCEVVDRVLLQPEEEKMVSRDRWHCRMDLFFFYLLSRL